MQTMKHASHTRPLLSQTKNNTTLWIGHLKADPTDHFAGQTFQCNSDGLLNNIQIFADAVQTPGEVILNLHSFDPVSKKWGEVLCSSKVNVERSDDERWVRFELPAIQLKSGNSYGFRLETPDAMVAIGEAASRLKILLFSDRN